MRPEYFSFDLWRSRRAKIAYIPIVATEYSLERFEEYGSIIYPCFTIDHEYNLLTNIPKYFPQWLTNTINVFEAINSMNKKLNKSGLGIAGQGELALTLAFLTRLQTQHFHYYGLRMKAKYIC